MINDLIPIGIGSIQGSVNGNIFLRRQRGRFCGRRKIQRIQHIDRAKKRLFIVRSLRQKMKNGSFAFPCGNKPKRRQKLSRNHVALRNRFHPQLQNAVGFLRQGLHPYSRKIRIPQQFFKVFLSKGNRIGSHSRFDHFKILLHDGYGGRKHGTVDRNAQTKSPKNQKSEKSDLFHISTNSFLHFDMGIFPAFDFFMQKLDNTPQK